MKFRAVSYLLSCTCNALYFESNLFWTIGLWFLLIILSIYSLDVGNSDGSTAKEVLAVLFKGVPYEELVNAFQFLDPVTKLIPHQKLSPETATYWRNLATYLHSESEVKGQLILKCLFDVLNFPKCQFKKLILP